MTDQRFIRAGTWQARCAIAEIALQEVSARLPKIVSGAIGTIGHETLVDATELMEDVKLCLDVIGDD